MHYKHKSTLGPVACNDGVERQVDEVYLLYIDRSTFQRMYFKIEMDEQGYGIITPIDQSGKIFETIRLQDVDSYEVLLHHSSIATNEQNRLAELNFSLYDVNKKFDTVYNYVREGTLPPIDFKLVFDKTDLDRELQCGRISKIKYNQAIKKGIPVGDFQCSYCNYKNKCLQDCGITLT